MLMFIEPVEINPWIYSIEQGPTPITIAEARASATALGNDDGLLLRWIDFLSTNKEYAHMFLNDIALIERISLPYEKSPEPITDMRSILKSMESASKEDLKKFRRFLKESC